jgi:hypothetical protein
MSVLLDRFGLNASSDEEDCASLELFVLNRVKCQPKAALKQELIEVS